MTPDDDTDRPPEEPGEGPSDEPSESSGEDGDTEDSIEAAAARVVEELDAEAAGEAEDDDAEDIEAAAARAVEALDAEEDSTSTESATPVERARQQKDPPDDVEMPLTEHIEEMLNRLVIVAVVGGAATLLALPFASDLVITMWYDIHPGDTVTCVPDPNPDDCTPPHLYAPLEQLLTEIKLASLAGITVALPAFVYQTYQFMRPGLYPHERRYYLASVPMSLVLALVGMAFAYFVILPLLFEVFLFYSEGSAEIAFALQETFDIMLMLMIVLALVFQIPLFIMLAIMMGVTSRRWLEQQRLYFWLAFAGIAFVFTVDPTGMAPVLVAITMIALFEGTLALLRWTGR